MSDLKNDLFDERDKKLLRAFLDGTKKLIKEAIDPIITALRENNIYVEPAFKANSLKQITEKGYELLSNHNANSYFEKNCLLLKDENLKNKDDVHIFIKCLDWIKKDGKEKAIEIRLNSNLNEEQCNELLALALMEKIKE